MIRLVAISFISVIYFSLYPVNGQAQDSTLQRLLTEKNDTNNVKSLLSYGMSLLDTENEKAVVVFQKTLERSKQLGYDFGTGSAYSRLGYIEGQAGNHQKAIRLNLAALELFDKINRVPAIAISYNNIGFNYDILGMADSSLFYYLKGIERIRDEHVKPPTLSTLYENVSTLFGNRNEISKAISYSEKAIQFASSIEDTGHLITAYTGLSNVYLKARDPHKALMAVRQARAFAKDSEEPVYLTKIYLNLAACQVALNNPDSAIIAAKKSMSYSEAYDLNNYLSAGMDLSDAYALKKDYSNQKKVLTQLQEKAEEAGRLYYLYDIYERLAHLHAGTGDYKNAFQYALKHGAYKDSFFSEKSRLDVAAIEARYRTAHSEKELAEHRLKLSEKNLALSKSNRYMGFSLAGLLVALLLATGIYLQSRNKKKIFASKLITLQKQQEIDLLRALMEGEEKERSRLSKELHDGVGGMLAASKMHLSSVAKTNASAAATEAYQQGLVLLDEAAREVRKTSHNLMPELLMQHGLDIALRKYCSSLSNKDRLVIQYDSWGDPIRFNSNFELFIYRIVQELLNNIIKHSGASQAIVQLSHQNNLLSITVEDNGIGFDPETFLSQGMGFKSLQSRVAALNGKLELESSIGNGVNAYLEFDTSASVPETTQSIPA